MLFRSIGFIFCFLPIVLATFHVLIGRGPIDAAKLWLFAASIVFYGNFIPVHLVLLGTSTVVRGRVLLKKPSRAILTVGLLFNLAILAVFKYADFLVANVNSLFDVALPTFGVVLPLSLSFFTFQKMAYLIDVYREGAPRYAFRHFVLFVVFFPQLIAGQSFTTARSCRRSAASARRATPRRIRHQGLELGPEQLHAIAPAPVQRLDSDAIANEAQCSGLAIPQRDGEHPDETRHRALRPPFAAGREHHLGVGAAAKRWPRPSSSARSSAKLWTSPL
jgi:hypothetical protein